MEKWDIYDRNKKKTGRTMNRNDWNMNDGDFHLTVIGIVQRQDGRFVVTKRIETKKYAPGAWEISGGGAMAGETSREAIIREIKEEIGLDVSKAKGGLVHTYMRENPQEGDNYFVDIYKFYMDYDENDVKIQSTEISEFKFVNSDEVQELAQKEEFLHYNSIKCVFKNEPQLFLIGFMGVGKTSIAKQLEKIMPYEVLEMDQKIVDDSGMSIPDIFEKYGEDYFRNLETNLVKNIETEFNTGKKYVVSCGGGVVVRSENTKIMKRCGKVVLLTASPQTIFERVKDDKNRPILNGNMNIEYIEQLMQKRKALYEDVADIVITTDSKDIQTIAEEIIHNIY
ncbi:shikimate kinase [Lachnobacterium bovis]|uniref:Shikimate kinase n=1 Tax=Lachnobacterium bovis TaxID=140626 RepID=A0A1H9RVF9_9FIRM|nr:shikimate kinase [Lachnobacterium bovis]SER76568.1 shikimate kinase [Lachnobacterium bovis]